MPRSSTGTGALLGALLVMSMGCSGKNEAQAQPGAPATGIAPAGAAVTAAGPRPILVELFTSEGCSSCPPADDLLQELWRKQPISGAVVIPLEYHVDYWDYIGWKDPYASADYTHRQKRYAAQLGARGLYTPQMVVQGTAEFVGSSGYRARSEIMKASRVALAEVKLGLSAGSRDSLDVEVAGLAPAAESDVWLAVSHSGLSTQVLRGENAGRRLGHAPIVRQLRSLGPVKDGRFQQKVELKLDGSWPRAQLQAVAFVQDRRTGRVLGVAAIGLGS